jgi:hypothetical protein
LVNCWNILRAFSTRDGDNLKDWTISSRASYEEGSTTIPEGSTVKWQEAPTPR